MSLPIEPKGRPVALLSGASRGIGAAVARDLAERGWQLSLGLRTPELPDGLPESTHIVAHDALKADEEGWAASALARFGRIDAVICCAGIMVPQSVIEVGDATLDAMWEVNVKSPRRLIRAAWVPLCASGRGRVIVLASLSGKRVKSAGSGAYAMTKHAAVALVHGVRQAGWDAGVRGTAICPGYVATDMARAITDFPEAGMTPPGDVARLVGLALDMPNETSLAELHVNCMKEEIY